MERPERPRTGLLHTTSTSSQGFDSLTPARWSCGVGICSTHSGAGLFGCEHPIDASALGIAPALPSGDLGDHPRVACDAPIEALADQDADLDLDHVQPAGVLGDVVELQTAQHSSGFVGPE